MSRYYLGVNTSHDASDRLFKDNALLVSVGEEWLDKDKRSLRCKISNNGNVETTLPFMFITYVLDVAVDF